MNNFSYQGKISVSKLLLVHISEVFEQRLTKKDLFPVTSVLQQYKIASLNLSHAVHLKQYMKHNLLTVKIG